MCREYSKVFVFPENDNVQIWQFMNFPNLLAFQMKVHLIFSKAINLFILRRKITTKK